MSLYKQTLLRCAVIQLTETHNFCSTLYKFINYKEVHESTRSACDNWNVHFVFTAGINVWLQTDRQKTDKQSKFCIFALLCASYKMQGYVGRKVLKVYKCGKNGVEKL